MADWKAKYSASESLRELLHNGSLSFAMEAHNGLSAIIAEKAGFEVIWASGLAISASLGLRDSNEATWCQVLTIAEFMADAVEIPIILDGDSGHGNFNTVRRLVRKACDRRIAGVCLEDKLFPKMNSFIQSGQILANVDEFAGRIMAAKDTQTSAAFTVIARTEALIAGRSLAEALDRASTYASAGADAIVIHSAKSTADEVLAFADAWANRCPLIIIPTKYYTTPTQLFRQARISLAIWANHSLRASVASMQAVCSRIVREQSVKGVEPSISKLETIFDLLKYDELLAAEQRYFPANGALTPGIPRVPKNIVSATKPAE
ncbi:phosphoenolpyruvate mutase [Rhodopseudomonas palustris]|uniref:phosphoenolpyruvate mutase n=1 Tax=Rhodopseudomonas palustris (strain BisB18) TaxID=316056 RepID=Q20ZN6_RHOPB